MPTRLLILPAMLALLLAAGCRDEKITAYRVPKETLPPPASADAMPTPSPATTSPSALPADLLPPAAAADATGPLAWQAPAAWTAQPLGAMRKGSYLVQDSTGARADISIIAFPGDAGGLAENLNRWRGQLQLPALSTEELAAASTSLAVGDLKFTVVDFAGRNASGPARILGAVLPLGDQTYFFKLIGPDSLAAATRPAFLDFLKTVKTR